MGLFITIVATIFEIFGLISAPFALFQARTSQGAIAWIISLLTIPYVAVPLFWIFGRKKFHGYYINRKISDAEMAQIAEKMKGREEWSRTPSFTTGRLIALEKLAKLPYTFGNRVRLLIDGAETFDSIFQGIETAREFILIQFFIVKSDEIGQELKKRLVQKAREGVDIYFLFDEFGSRKLRPSYWEELRHEKIHVSPFHSTRGKWNRFQLNFRNHRKVVVVDGKIGWIGGHNVGDEYLGKYKKFGHWRDTHIRLEGPAVLGMMLSFLEDWYWATSEKLELSWESSRPVEDGHTVMVIPSGPADEYDTASLMIQQAIQAANERFWVASPYFVPDEGVMQALHLAALRGIDVRILIPDKLDHILPYLSAFAFVDDMIKSGIKVFRYKTGFLHQKVFLVDSVAAAVGTVNLDNRSFRLSFEITAIVFGKEFADEVEEMLKKDFANSREMTLAEIHQKPLWFKLASRASFLAAPVQ